jgi:hypothetical protein
MSALAREFLRPFATPRELREIEPVVIFLLSWCEHIDLSARLRLADTVKGQWQKRFEQNSCSIHMWKGIE